MHKHLQRVVVGALFASLLFISTGKVFAETVDEATTDLPDTSGALCVDLPRDLSYTIQDSGDRHDVLLLQTFLQSRGFLKNNPTGYYGAQTRLAVRNFQIAVNLPGVGSVGPLTRAAIKNISCNSAPMPVTTTVAAVPPMCPAGYICRPPTDDSNTSVAVAGWKTYELVGNLGKISLQYPLSSNVSGATGMHGESFDVYIENFTWQYDGYSFPNIKSLLDDRLYVQIRSLDNSQKLTLSDWLKNTITTSYNSPERVEVVGEHKGLYGEVVEQQQKVVDGTTAIQRTVKYPTALGDYIKITYTYVNKGSEVFQFINHNSTSASSVDTYNKIVSTFKFTSPTTQAKADTCPTGWTCNVIPASPRFDSARVECPTGYICTSPTANTVTTNSTSLGMPALSLSGHNLHISWTAYAADYYRIKLSNTAGASLPRNTALITTVDGSQNSFTTDIYEQIKSYLDINNLTSTADATLPGNFAKSFVITVEAVKKGVAGVSGTSQAFTMAVDGNRANVTVSADAIAKIRTTNEDYAGAWGQFKPGVGSANKDRADWGWSLTLTSVPYPRIIRDITITSDTQGWSTSDRGEFPLVVVNAGAQLNTSAGQTFTVPAYTTYTLFLYGQKESTQWSGGSIKITFSDGTSLTRSIAGISASSVSDATHKPVITMVRAKAGAPFEAYIGEDLDIEGMYLADSGGTAHVYFGPWGGSYGDAVTATTKQISDTLVRVTVPELSTGQNFLGISNRNGESSFVQVKVIRHEQSSTPTITATLMGSGADYAGKFGEFEPGVGLGNTTPADWQWSLKLSASNARRVIKNITISHKSGVEAWSTANASAYPLVVVKNNNQLNFSYGDYITLLPNEDTLTLYGQREDTTWTHGNIEVNFTDGTTLRSDIQM